MAGFNTDSYVVFSGGAGRREGERRSDGTAEDAVQMLTERTLPKERGEYALMKEISKPGT